MQQDLEQTGIPDASLLEVWVKHQRQADFTEIVRRHLGLVQGIARRQLDADHAEDIAQRVFAILARKASSLTDLRSLAAWLHRVTLLQCRSAVRGQIRNRRNMEAAMETARIADARDPLADALPHLDAAIGDLSESDRELILLRYSEGLTFSEAAKRTGRKEAALRQQASRAVEKLSGMLRRRGVSVPVATLTTGLGIHLAGSSTASAAALVVSAALGSTGGITGLSLAGLTFLTMTTKQSILTGAVLAALLVTGPLAWQATRIRQAEQSLAAISPVTAPGSPAKTRSVPDRSAKPLSEIERDRMIDAIPGIFEATIKECMNEWGKRDAWVEARRTARALGLSAELETGLRNLLISEHARTVAGMDLERDKDVDRAGPRREREARLDAWYVANLTPEQSEARKQADAARNGELVEKLAATAVGKFSPDLDLTPEQQSLLHVAAAAKVRHSLEEKAYSNSWNAMLRVDFNGSTSRVEEESPEFVHAVLDSGQQELWQAAVERDHGLGEMMQRRVIGGVLEQVGRLKLTREELAEPFEE